jgi:aldose 1-epimerase
MNINKNTWERTGPNGAILRGLTIDNGVLSADIVPEAGGGLARLDIAARGDRLRILRPLAPDVDPYDPDNLACYPLVPWSNRIGHGRFRTSNGVTVKIEPNRKGERYPLHGYGWQSRWEIVEHNTRAATLRLDYSAGTPFAFVSTIHYELVDATLQVVLTVTNRGPSMLYGLGLHPWLPRSPKITLCAPARGMWAAGSDGLPTAHVPVPGNYQFGKTKELPCETVDNAFTGWNGIATVMWPESGVSMQIRSNVTYYVLYAPLGKNFFCFEPVDHPANAHNLPGIPTQHGLTELTPGASLTRAFAFDVNVSAALGTGHE